MFKVMIRVVLVVCIRDGIIYDESPYYIEKRIWLDNLKLIVKFKIYFGLSNR